LAAIGIPGTLSWHKMENWRLAGFLLALPMLKLEEWLIYSDDPPFILWKANYKQV
jgi:hypothetical protein